MYGKQQLCFVLQCPDLERCWSVCKSQDQERKYTGTMITAVEKNKKSTIRIHDVEAKWHLHNGKRFLENGGIVS